MCLLWLRSSYVEVVYVLLPIIRGSIISDRLWYRSSYVEVLWVVVPVIIRRSIIGSITSHRTRMYYEFCYLSSHVLPAITQVL